MTEIRISVTDKDGKEAEITGINRDDWHRLKDPCPECGHHEFNHFGTTGGQYGKQEQAIIERTDYWDAKHPLYTQCMSCNEILFKHPAFDLLFDLNGENNIAIEK